MTIDRRQAAPSETRREDGGDLCALDGLTADDIAVDAVSAHGWRVTDARLSARDPLHLLAYIELREQRFEVLQIGAGFEWHEFTVLSDAIAFVLHSAVPLAHQRVQDGHQCWSARTT